MMENTELINKLRILRGAILNTHHRTGEYVDKRFADVVSDAADALEADERRIEVLEAQMPKRGEWFEKWRFKTDGTPFHKIGDMECSVCHGDMLGRYYSKYCPHCGAKMRTVTDCHTLDERRTV